MPSFRRYLLPWGLTLAFLALLSILYRAPFTDVPPTISEPGPESAFRQEIVVASLSDDDTSWLEKELPGWGRSVYVVNDKTAKLTVPINKGREAMVYLT